MSVFILYVLGLVAVLVGVFTSTVLTTAGVIVVVITGVWMILARPNTRSNA